MVRTRKSAQTPQPSQTASSPISLSSHSMETTHLASPQARSAKSSQKLHPERGFALADLPKAMKETIRSLKWEMFAANPTTQPVTAVTREFYQGIHANGNDLTEYSVMRKKLVPFDADEINQHFGIEYQGQELEHLVSKMTRPRMEELKGRIAKPGVNWEKSGGQSGYKLRRTELTEEAKVWFFLVCYKLLPTTHVTYIEKDRLVLLDAIMRGERLNIGSIIVKQIKECKQRKIGCLFFPCLITELAQKAQVPISDGEETWPTMKAIDAQTLERCKAPVQKGSNTERQGSEGVPREQLGEETPKFFAEFLKKQEAFWGYMQEFHAWIANGGITLGALERAPPAFPDFIIPPMPQPQHSPPTQPQQPPSSSPKRKRATSPEDKGKQPAEDSSYEEGSEEEDLDSPTVIARYYSSTSPSQSPAPTPAKKQKQQPAAEKPASTEQTPKRAVASPAAEAVAAAPPPEAPKVVEQGPVEEEAEESEQSEQASSDGMEEEQVEGVEATKEEQQPEATKEAAMPQPEPEPEEIVKDAVPLQVLPPLDKEQTPTTSPGSSKVKSKKRKSSGTIKKPSWVKAVNKRARERAAIKASLFGSSSSK